MKIPNLVICAFLCSIAAGNAEDLSNLFPFGDMEAVDSSQPAPEGWFPVGVIELGSDESEFKSGARSLSIRTPEKPAVASSNYISVLPNTSYEVEASVLARGSNQSYRPSVGLRIQGANSVTYPPEEGKYLIIWSPSEEEVGFVTRKARFVTDSKTHKVRITLLVRSKPAGTVNVDDVILRIADQVE